MLLSVGEIKQIQSKILASSKNYNLIPKLINQYEAIASAYKHLSDKDQLDDLEIVSRGLNIYLGKIFESLMQDGSLMCTKSDAQSSRAVKQWLISQYETFKEYLFSFITLECDFVHQNNDVSEGFKTIKVEIIEIVINLVKNESRYFSSGDPFFSYSLYKELVFTLMVDTGDLQADMMQNGLMNNYLLLEFMELLMQHWDLNYYFISSLEEISADESLTSVQRQMLVSNFLTVLKSVSKPLVYDFETQLQNTLSENVPHAVKKLGQYRTNFEKSILRVLAMPLMQSQYKTILQILHKRIITLMSNPTKLMDFLTDSYNLGFEKDIEVSVLSLNGLFELMQSYNLEYDDFFIKLYAILSPRLLHLQLRSRFFRLLDVFLQSTHLPAAIVASFIKRLARLCLTAPPAGIVIVIPFIYNLLKKHPTCMLMIHNTQVGAEYQDPFKALERDPLHTEAISSSIWELESINSHYHPNVASLAKIYSQPFNKYKYNLEDFLDWNYNNLLENELNKNFKSEIALEFENFDTVMGNQADEGVYIKGWSW